MKYSVPVTFTAFCRVYVDADNWSDAIEKAMKEYNNHQKLGSCHPVYMSGSVRPAYGVNTVNEVHLVH